MKGNLYTTDEVGKVLGIVAHLVILRVCGFLKIKPEAEISAGKGVIRVWSKIAIDAVTPEELARAKRKSRKHSLRPGNISSLIPGGGTRINGLETRIAKLEEEVTMLLKAFGLDKQKELPLDEAVARELQGTA
jgi:hypothetical protein